MQTYLLRRVLAVIPVMLVVATVTFVLVHLAPGDPASIIAGPDATPKAPSLMALAIRALIESICAGVAGADELPIT